MSAPPRRPSPLSASRLVAAQSFADPAAAIAAVLGLARGLLGVSTTLVTKFDGEDWHAVHVDDDHFGLVAGATLRLQDTLCSLVRLDEPVVLNDVPNHPHHPRGRSFPASGRLGVRTFLGVPLVLKDGTHYGTLCVLDERVGTFGDQAISMLRVLARLVVHELEHESSLDAAREEGELRFRAMVESSNDAIAATTMEGITVAWNPAAERMYGFSAEEAIGRSIGMLVPPGDEDELPGVLARLSAGEQVDHYEARRVGKDGRLLDAILAVSPIRDDIGGMAGASVIAHDVTERRAFEKRLAAAEHRERARTGALLRAAEALNEAGPLDDLMLALAAAAAAAVDSDRASVYAYDERLTRTIAEGRYDAERAGGAPHLPAEPEVIAAVPPWEVPAEAEVIRGKRPLVRDGQTPFPPRFRPDDWHSDVVVPLLAGGAVQGVLYVRDAGRERIFADEEIALLQGIGHQAGLAILRARDAAAAERRAEHLSLLNRVGRALVGSLDVDQLCAAIHAEVGKVLAVDACYVALYQEGDTQIWFPYMVDRGNRVAPNWLPLGDGPTSRVLRDRQPEIAAPGAESVGTRGFVFGTDRRSSAALHVPMLRDERLIGALSVQRYDRKPYDVEELHLLETIAQQAAVAFAHARLHADTVAGRDLARRHAADLEAVLTISRSVASAADLETMLDVLAIELAALVPHDFIALYRLAPDGEGLQAVFVRQHGVNVDASGWTFNNVDEGLVGRAFVAGTAELVNDAHLDPRSARPFAEARQDDHGHHLALAPLVVADQRVGVLVLCRVEGPPFGRDEFSLFGVLAEQAAGAIRSAELLARNRELYLGGIEALAAAVDAKDPSTRGHSERVRRLTARVAVVLGCGRPEVEAFELAALLHDVGKIGIPDAILQKPGPLDDAERAIMVGHAALGADILAGAGAAALLPLVPLIRHHHEWVDGRGYPDALAGDAIPLGAAIIAVADAFDTMVTDRPYRPARGTTEAVAELRRRAGTQFRGDVVEALARLIAADGAAAGAPPTAPRPAPLAVGEGGPGPEAPSVGQMGDTRALGLLVELAALTRHIPDLNRFLARVVGIVRRRLDYQDVMLLLVDRDRGELVLAAHSGDEPSIRPDHRQPLAVGVLGEVVRTGRSWNVPDIAREPRYHSERVEPRGSELAVPLIAEGRTVGVVNVESERPGAFTAGDEAVLTAVAGQLASAVHVAQLHDVAIRAAATDGLTGLANHRAFYRVLEEATTAGRPLSVLLMDVEGLKRVNDSAGHLAGDDLLRRVARVAREFVRPGDVVARYGGDEFAVIMHGVGREEAARVGARVRQALIAHGGSDAAGPTVRYGVAASPDDGVHPTDIVASADRRLYEMRDRAAPARSRPERA